jgi:hypothetical protein
MSYPYNLFETIENISYKKLLNIKDIFSTISRYSIKSILDDFKLEIDSNFKASDKTNSNNFGLLKRISDQIYEDILINDYDIIEFFISLINFKDIISSNKKFIDNFIDITKNIKNNNKYNQYTENLFYYNPINSKCLENNFLINSVINNLLQNYNFNDDNEEELVKISLDILQYGDIINISLPSIGVIQKKYSLINSGHIPFIKYTNYLDFFQEIINNQTIEGKPLKRNIPLLSLNIGDTLADILLNISKNELFNNIDNINYNNTIKNLISNLINKIDINLHDIYYKNDKIKPEFIIPYEFNIRTFEVKEFNKTSSSKIKDFNNLFKHNNDIILFVINELTINRNYLEKKNYKNVLACYLYYIINVLYEILYNYINKIDIILQNLLMSKDKRFKILNIEDAFQYTTLLKESLIKFKFILLNNFYELFLPNNYTENSYGMKLNSNNHYVPDSEFMSDKIIDNYPFWIDTNKIVTYNINGSFESTLNFICTIKNKKDIYNNINLEFGGLVFNSRIQNYSIKFLKEYYTKLNNSNKFNLFCIDKIIYSFNVNKSIPFELIYFNLNLNIRNLMSNKNLSLDDKIMLERLLLHKYEENIDKSSKYFIKYSQIKYKINISKKSNIQDLLNKKELYYLYFNTYFTIANSIYVISDKDIADTKLKYIILTNYNKIKTKYENIIDEYLAK